MMMGKSETRDALTLALIQTDLYWEEKGANLAMFEEKIWQLPEAVDVILLPEMFNTGFSMNAKQLAEPLNGPAFRWMQQMADQANALVLGSVISRDGERFYNRLYWVEPKGIYDLYDKRHLFRMGNEHLTYTYGKERLIKEYKGWRICPLVCYDLRFPVWSRNTRDKETGKPAYDLLIYLANWPMPRVHVWDVLLKARALENLAFVAGLNRIGKDGEGIAYCGHSNVYDFKGKGAWEIREDAFIDIVKINRSELDDFRNNFPAHLDADEFSIKS